MQSQGHYKREKCEDRSRSQREDATLLTEDGGGATWQGVQKAEQTDSSLEPSEGRLLCQPLLDFRPPEL